MTDVIETIAIIFAVALVAGTILSFVAFMRHIAHKEKEIIAKYEKENGN
ncbi:MAG: hypothetical protein AAF614_29320 [Chloroflexota bacterium]